MNSQIDVTTMAKKVCAISICLALTACSTVKPDAARTTFEVPLEYVAKNPNDQIEPAAANETWWHDLEDSQLNEFIEVALLRNPALSQAIAQTRIAEAQTRIQRADQLPQVGLGIGTTRQKQRFLGLPAGAAPAGGVINTVHNTTLDISWELDLWGRLSALTASSRASYLASQEQQRAMRQSIAAQVIQMYFDIVQARAQTELSERTVEALGEMARQIENRANVGIVSPADSTLAVANLESARAGLEQRRETLERSLRQLEVLMGQYPAGKLATAKVLPPVPLAPKAGLPAELLERRPDVRAAELRLLSAGYQLGAAKRSFLPSISLTGSGGYTGTDFSELFSSNNLIWSIAGRLVQPIFQGGRLVAQVDVATGQRDEAIHAYAEVALNALAEVETSLAVDEILKRRESALDSSARAAEEAVHVSLNRYLQGIDPFLNVLESQQRALDGRSAHISAQYNRLLNRVSMHLALGGGFENTPTSNVNPNALERKSEQ